MTLLSLPLISTEAARWPTFNEQGKMVGVTKLGYSLVVLTRFSHLEGYSPSAGLAKLGVF